MTYLENLLNSEQIQFCLEYVVEHLDVYKPFLSGDLKRAFLFAFTYIFPISFAKKIKLRKEELVIFFNNTSKDFSLCYNGRSYYIKINKNA